MYLIFNTRVGNSTTVWTLLDTPNQRFIYLGNQLVHDYNLFLFFTAKFKTMNGKVEVYDDDFIKSFNCDTSYLYHICHAIQNGWQNFPEWLLYKLIGQAHKGR